MNKNYKKIIGVLVGVVLVFGIALGFYQLYLNVQIKGYIETYSNLEYDNNDNLCIDIENENEKYYCYYYQDYYFEVFADFTEVVRKAVEVDDITLCGEASDKVFCEDSFYLNKLNENLSVSYCDKINIENNKKFCLDYFKE